jgi:hypothetical protein
LLVPDVLVMQYRFRTSQSCLTDYRCFIHEINPEATCRTAVCDPKLSAMIWAALALRSERQGRGGRLRIHAALAGQAQPGGPLDRAWRQRRIRGRGRRALRSAEQQRAAAARVCHHAERGQAGRAAQAGPARLRCSGALPGAGLAQLAQVWALRMPLPPLGFFSILKMLRPEHSLQCTCRAISSVSTGCSVPGRAVISCLIGC